MNFTEKEFLDVEKKCEALNYLKNSVHKFLIRKIENYFSKTNDASQANLYAHTIEDLFYGLMNYISRTQSNDRKKQIYEMHQHNLFEAFYGSPTNKVN